MKRIPVNGKFLLYATVLCLLLFSSATAEMGVQFNDVTTTDGEVIAAKELNGSPVVLSIMAYWCPSCRAEAYELQKAYKTYRDTGVRFLALFIRSSDKGIKQFVERNGVTFPAGQDTGLARQLGVWSVPVTFIIARDGTVTKRYFGRISQSAIKRGIEEIQK
jgi:peroxiredoxin